jgi:hypothetical protein
MTHFSNSPVIILDEDWAPDFVLSETIKILQANQVKSTWFITHQSNALDEMRNDPALFELGIHPNFLPGSTHGNTTEEVIAHCLAILPDAVSMRTHAYAQSSLLYSYIANQTKIQIDASVFTPHTYHLMPFQYYAGKRPIHRTPVFWEDDNEMKIPGFSWDINQIDFSQPGLKIFAFHPIHIYLNTTSLDEYITIKKNFPNLSDAAKTDLDQFIQRKDQGTRDFFLEIVQMIARQKESYMLYEVIPTI